MKISSLKFTSKQILAIKYLSFVLVILGSLIISMLLTLTKAGQLYYDETAYASLARAIQTYGILRYYDSLRTYGYPLTLAILDSIRQILLPTIPLPVFLAFIQFIFHTLSSCLSVGCLHRLIASEKKLAWQNSIFCFAFVQFTPLLLTLTTDFLTDNVSVFLLTLFIYCLLVSHKYKLLWASTTLALIIVVRPFYALWAVILAIALGTIWILAQLISRNLQHVPRQNQSKRVMLRKRMLYVLVPLLGIVGLQYAFEYRAEKRLDLVGSEANAYTSLHLADAMFSLKYETYVGDTGHSPQVYYVDQVEKERSEELVKQFGVSTPWSFTFRFPIQAIQIFAVKTIAMFQNYQWEIYRTNLENSVNFVYTYGLIIFILFIYVNLSFVSQIRPRILQFIGWTPNASLVLIVIDLHIFTYSIPTVPEGRFLAPIIPILSSLAIYIWITKKNFVTLFVSIFIATPLYILVYYILLKSLV